MRRRGRCGSAPTRTRSGASHCRSRSEHARWPPHSLATTVRLVASHAYPDGAPPGFSGGFKEESCHACHFHAEPNSGPGRVTIEGVPAAFAAGERYTLTVTLSARRNEARGFQLAARFKDGGAQAGTLAPGSERRGTCRRGDFRAASSTRDRRRRGPPSTAADTRWTIEWTAPDGGGPVIFHVSANAADGDGSADGDFVYTTTGESAPLAPLAASGNGGRRLTAALAARVRAFGG